MEYKLQKIFIFSLIVILVVVYVYRYIDKKDVLDEHRFTKGRIIKYYFIGSDKSYYLDYCYYINSDPYYRTVGTRRFVGCEDDFKFCEKKIFWVAYSIKDVSKSLIDLTNEIQDVKNPEFPKSMDNFK